MNPDIIYLIKNILKSNQRYILNSNLKIEIGTNYASGWEIYLPRCSNLAVFSTVITDINKYKSIKDMELEAVMSNTLDIADPVLYKLLDRTKELTSNYNLIEYSQSKESQFSKAIGIASPKINFISCNNYVQTAKFSGRYYLCLFELLMNVRCGSPQSQRSGLGKDSNT